MKCWICEIRGADSAEHDRKHSDIVREYGRGGYRGDVAPVLYRNGKFTDIQGPKSALLKFGKSICRPCNDAHTQPFDFAYDRFIDWVVKNEATVMRQRFIDFVDIYGEDFEPQQRNLFRYFAKVFGCALRDQNHVVPDDIVNLLREQHFFTALSISMSVDELVAAWPSDLQYGFSGSSKIGVEGDGSSALKFYYRRHFRWLTVFMSYGVTTSGRLGSIWVADKRVVHLGTDEQSPFRPRVSER
jgi:hypothetical protein